MLKDKDDGKQWLLELTQSITGQLKQNREDIVDIWEHIHRARDIHISCREQILAEVAKIDKRVEVIMVRLGVYVAICTFLLTVGLHYLLKHLGH